MIEHHIGKVLSIIGWHDRFENNRSREVKDAKWFACPNSFDGDRISELLSHENGAAHYGAWCAILGVASTCGVRGTLVRDNGKPYCADSLSWKTRIPVEVFNQAIPRMIDIGLIEVLAMEVDTDTDVIEIPQEGATKPQEGATKPQATAASSILFSSIPSSSVLNSEKEKSESKKDGKRRAVICTEEAAAAIFAAYPRRIGKRAAVKEIIDAAKRIAADDSHEAKDDPVAYLTERTAAYAASAAGQQANPDYRPHPERWFKKARYDDDPATWTKPNGDSVSAADVPRKALTLEEMEARGLL